MDGPFEETGMGDIPEANNIKIIKKLPGSEDSCRAVAL